MKTAVVTGSSRGIGREIARKLSEEGYNVVINYNHSKTEAESLLSELLSSGRAAIAVQADVSQKEGADKLIREAVKAFGSVDALVNNAGISRQKLFQDITEANLKEMFEHNFYSAFYCSQAAVREMLPRQSGVLVNISSMWGEIGASCESHYAASKAAMISLTKSLAKELGLSGIRVNCVSPGVIATDMNKNLAENELSSLKEQTPLNCLGTPSDIAEAVCFLCSDKAKFITGQVLSVNGGFVI